MIMGTAEGRAKVKASKLSQLLERALCSNYPRQRAIFYLVKVMLYFYLLRLLFGGRNVALEGEREKTS